MPIEMILLAWANSYFIVIEINFNLRGVCRGFDAFVIHAAGLEELHGWEKGEMLCYFSNQLKWIICMT